jgi:hypothetical protein
VNKGQSAEKEVEMRPANKFSLVMLLVTALAIITGSGFTQTVVPPEWLPGELKIKVAMDPVPKTTLDQEIAMLLNTYQPKIAALDHSDPVVQRYLPGLQENIIILYQEYNLDHARKSYDKSDFTPSECMQWLKKDMDFYLPKLASGADPALFMAGSWMGKAYWHEDSKIMGMYDLHVPNNYNPMTSWPLIVSTQNNPSTAVIKASGYLMASSIKKGYSLSDVKEQGKNRCIILDVARDMNVDPFRLYATGFSKGGHQSLKLGFRYPGWFAGIIPVHHDMKQTYPWWSNAANLINTPTLLIHGPDGYHEPELLELMENAGCPVREYLDGTGHTAEWAYQDSVEFMVEFMDTASMNPFPKVVQHTVEHKRYSRAFWTNARLAADEAQLTAQYRVELNDNHIELKLLNSPEKFSSFDFYLTDQLVDMSKNVVVTLAGDTLFNGMPGEKISVLVRAGAGVHALVHRLLWQELDSIRTVHHGYTSDIGTPVSLIVQNTASAIMAYPNPFKNATTISFPNFNRSADIVIYDIQGREVFRNTGFAGIRLRWDASRFANGIYTVRIKSGNRIFQTRLTLVK